MLVKAQGSLVAFFNGTTGRGLIFEAWVGSLLNNNN
jgi:hypothetical protein